MIHKMNTYTVFISSTFLDNQERRKLVEDAVLRAGMQPVGMERFTAAIHPTVEKCEQEARDCDLYIGIIAHRYGWIPDGKGISITELEYEAAKGVNWPRLMFEVDRSVRPDIEMDFDPQPGRWTKQEKLDEFRAKYRQDQMPTLFTETTLGVKVLHALNNWCEEREGTLPAPNPAQPDSAEASRELDRYRNAALARHAELPLAGFATKLRVPIDLEELYVPLHARVDLRFTGGCGFADARDAEERLGAHGSDEIPLIEAFREARKRKRRGIVVLGDPGSGKTTHLKRLLLACLREGPAGLGLAADMLPVFLPLRDLEDLTQGIDAFIEKTLESPHLRMPQGFGGRLLDRGRLLLLFDGLDEVSDPKERARVSRWIEQAAQARPECTVVVTCRFAGYDDDARLSPEFLELHLRPLSREQSETFIRNWYRAVETGLAKDPAQGDIIAGQRALELIERLRQPDFRAARMLEMTRNPLLLSNLCLVHRDRGALPRNRHQLYDECIEVLLERWRREKKLSVSVSARAGREILGPVALWLHRREGRTRAGLTELTPVLESALKAAQWRGNAAGFLRTIRDESGLLTGWGPDQFGFMHLGFQEYLAAMEIRRQALKQAVAGEPAVALMDLAGHYGESWWQEVILLLLAQGDPPLFTPFMNEAIRQRLYEEGDPILAYIQEEAAEFSAEPWLHLVRDAGKDRPVALAVKAAALKVLGRLLSREKYGRVLESLPPDLYRLAAGKVRLILKVAPEPEPSLISRNGRVELIFIPGGRFLMGSPPGVGRDNEHPQHEVEIGPFYLGRYPVTNEEYGRYLAENPGVREPAYWADRRYNQARQPVVGVSWEDAQRFCEWAGGRLPTEAEWEYACLAGTTTEYWWGDEIGVNRANGRETGSPWSGKQTSPVGSFAPNPFGLYDTHGNVWEWVRDVWHGNYEDAPVDGSTWKIRGDGGRRVVRGGSWFGEPSLLRSASRSWSTPDYWNDNLGFRLAQDS